MFFGEIFLELEMIKEKFTRCSPPFSRYFTLTDSRVLRNQKSCQCNPEAILCTTCYSLFPLRFHINFNIFLETCGRPGQAGPILRAQGSNDRDAHPQAQMDWDEPTMGTVWNITSFGLMFVVHMGLL